VVKVPDSIPWQAEDTTILSAKGHIGTISGSHTIGALEAALRQRRAERQRDREHAAYAVHAANLYPEMLEVLRDLVAISHEVSTRNELAGRAYILIKKAEKA